MRAAGAAGWRRRSAAGGDARQVAVARPLAPAPPLALVARSSPSISGRGRRPAPAAAPREARPCGAALRRGRGRRRRTPAALVSAGLTAGAGVSVEPPSRALAAVGEATGAAARGGGDGWRRFRDGAVAGAPRWAALARVATARMEPPCAGDCRVQSAKPATPATATPATIHAAIGRPAARRAGAGRHASRRPRRRRDRGSQRSAFADAVRPCACKTASSISPLV